jgi:hypothetical protein
MGVSDQVGASSEDIDAIKQAALDYLEGYVRGDAQRHHGSYHPEAMKRRYNEHEGGVFGIASLSPQTMADWAARREPDDVGDVEIIIDGVYRDIATVRVYSQWWVDFLHIVKARGAWKLFHVTWHDREEVAEG